MTSGPATESSPGGDLRPLGVLVVDDQRAVREGVARLISSAPLTLREIRTAATCEEARKVAAWLKPDLVVLDVDLNGEDGLALMGQLGASARVLVLSSHGDAETRARAKRLGASAFVEKQEPAADLLGTIVDLTTLQMGGDKTPR